MNKGIGILCLGLLILMVGVSLGQELDDKMPLLDEPIIAPKEEIPQKKSTEPTEKLQEAILPSTSLGTPTTEPKEELGGTVTQIDTLTIKEEPKILEKPKEVITSPSQVSTSTTLGTITPTLATPTTNVSISGSKEEITVSPQPATTTVISSQEYKEGTITPTLGTLTTQHLVGTLTTGTATIEAGTPTSKEGISLLNTGLILVPTAYRRDNKFGFNTDFIIAYYIGELWHSMNKGEFFEPIKFLFISGDFKFSWRGKNEQLPNLGTGYEWFLVLQGGASTPAQMGGKFSGESHRFGYPYFIFSKRFKYLNCHLGMMSGEIGNLFNPLSEFADLHSNKAIIFGLDTKLFNRQINIEGIYPVGTEFHILVHTSIERFLVFDVGFMKMPKGLSIIGYFGIRLTIFPYIKE